MATITDNAVPVKGRTADEMIAFVIMTALLAIVPLLTQVANGPAGNCVASRLTSVSAKVVCAEEARVIASRRPGTFRASSRLRGFESVFIQRRGLVMHV